MDDSDSNSVGRSRDMTTDPLDGSAAHKAVDQDFLAYASSKIAKVRAPRQPQIASRDLVATHALIVRVFDTLETLQLQCSVLEAEKTYAAQTSESLLRDASDRIRDLEEVVTGLMRLVSKYDALLLQAAGRTMDAEQRAAYAELRNRDTERGASDAVEWLYRYMTGSIPLPR